MTRPTRTSGATESLEARSSPAAAGRRLEWTVVFAGQVVVAACDGICSRAWGVNRRPSVQLSADLDDFAWLADGELGEAPDDPGTGEGGHPPLRDLGRHYYNRAPHAQADGVA